MMSAMIQIAAAPTATPPTCVGSMTSQLAGLAPHIDGPTALSIRDDLIDRLNAALELINIVQHGLSADCRWPTPQQYTDAIATANKCLERLAFIDARLSELDLLQEAARAAVARAFTERHCTQRSANRPVFVPRSHRRAYRRYKDITSQPACAHAPPVSEGLHNRPCLVGLRGSSKVVRGSTPLSRSTLEATVA